MCGISVVCEHAAASVVLDRLRSMHARVAHRGPDGEGWLAIDDEWHPIVAPTEDALRAAVGTRHVRIAAAFRWLRIQDLHPSSGQPMGSASGETWVLFNGEIYNHLAIRRELTSQGRTFRTNSDTEALLVAYEHWGTECFSHLDGMWGAVIVDTRRRSIVVARDRFGIRPLFYRAEGRTEERVDAPRLLLGSEAKQVACPAEGPPAVNRDAVFDFLWGRRLDCEDTYFDGVRAVPPASWARITFDPDPAALTSSSFRRYWHLREPEYTGAVVPATLTEATERLDALLQDAVAGQSVAAVTLGALLSGGLDSSIVSALMVAARRHTADHSWLISVTQDSATGELDERPYMRAVAAAVAGDDVTAVEAPLDTPWVESWMDKATWHQEEPLGGIALVAQCRAYHAAAAHGVRVVLEGTGADEIFAGYPRHQFTMMRDHLQRRRVVAAAREFGAALTGDRAFRTWFRDTTGAALRRRVTRGMSRARRPVWMRADATSGLKEKWVSVEVRPSSLSALQAMQWQDLLRGNVPAVLAIADRNAMAHSIESRVPYLDHRVVELGFWLRDTWKTTAGDRKIVLREVARKRVPPIVAERRARIGFGMPIGDWMRGSLRSTLLETVHSQEVTRSSLFEPSGTQHFVTDFLEARHQDMASVWRIFALARWMRVYGAAV